MRVSTVVSLLMGGGASFASPVEERTACRTGAANPSQTVSAFKRDGVIPTLIPSLNVKVDGSFVFGSKAVNLGNTLTTLDTAGLGPDFQITCEAGQSASTTYSIFLVDPDVPSPEGAPVTGVRVNFLHYYVSGIEPCQAYTAASALANTVTVFELPTPLSPQEQHRYTFLIYREPAGYTPALISAQVRPAFQVNDYARKGGLTLVGGNFFKQSITDGVLTPTPGGTLVPVSGSSSASHRQARVI